MGCSTVETGRSLDKRWALSRPSDAQRLWGSMRQWAGLDAQLLRDDWMICLRPNLFLIDSEMSQSVILKYNSRRISSKFYIQLFWTDPEAISIPSEFTFLKNDERCI